MGRKKPRRLAPEQAPRLDVRIDDLDHEGRGVGRVDGKVVFVDGGLPGERVRARCTTRAKRFDEAVVEALLEPSAERVEPFCPVFGRCGGCTLQHLAPAAQLRQRERRVHEQLTRAAGAAPAQWLPPLTGPDRGYRTRARLTVRYVRRQGVLLGFRERGGRHVVDTDACAILDDRLERLIPQLKTLIASLDRPERVSELELAASDGDTVVAFQYAGAVGEADRARLARFQDEAGVAIELAGGARTGPLDAARPADAYYALPDEDLVLRFAAGDFVQSNATVNRALVGRAMELLAPEPGQTVLDLYCGIGNFSLPAASRGAAVTGIEGDAGLVERAAVNARANGLAERTDFQQADLAAAPLADWLQRLNPAAVLLDPPRAGAPEAVTALVARPPRRIVYVSCDPATLARDVGRLTGEGGYCLQAAGIADMFPHSGHVEAIAALESV
ncbi:23S rRNA (uracil(1939)-C(5))-methyltransferase RlmD [Halofilum ochraceum]|uniref:23S rRNA (uracil(1939)-C(5))-methyltransferase RlmD n=1 Tax=Halofilum ochraceum TaxID=1611323 RepID=UPI0008DA5739|nr:23S rRNA (uracil(1939)-C(5))-methyltransferase RlmD [Halofilum ochraceum]